jgi:hypothetical protein
MNDILKVRKWVVISRAQFNIHLESIKKVTRIKDKRIFCWDDKVMYLNKIGYIVFFHRDNIHLEIFTADGNIKVPINDVS